MLLFGFLYRRVIERKYRHHRLKIRVRHHLVFNSHCYDFNSLLKLASRFETCIITHFCFSLQLLVSLPHKILCWQKHNTKLVPLFMALKVIRAALLSSLSHLSHYLDGGDVSLKFCEDINRLGNPNYPIKGPDIPGAFPQNTILYRLEVFIIKSVSSLALNPFRTVGLCFVGNRLLWMNCANRSLTVWDDFLMRRTVLLL